MAGAYDLADLIAFGGRFGPGGDPAGGSQGGDIGFHQGVVTAWDASTGENTLMVAGGVVHDIPVLSTADSIMLNVGDTVGLIRFKSTYFILGRIAPPGGGAAMGIRSATVRTQQSLNSGSKGVYRDLATVGPRLENVYIGSSRRCLVITNCGVGCNNASGFFSFEVSGASSIDPADLVAGGMYVNNNQNGGSTILVTTSATRVLTAADGLNEGLNTFTMKYSYDTVNNGSGATFEARTITVFPF